MKNIFLSLSFALAMLLFGCSKDDTTPVKISIDPYTASYTVKQAMALNMKDHDEANDAVYNESDVVEITLKASSIEVSGKGASVSGKVVTINSPGTYRVSGTIADGRVIVDVSKDDVVRIVLNNADITCTTGAPMFIAGCKKTIVVLADGSDNFLADHSAYIFDLPADKEPNAALFSKDDLTICGSGKLTVTGKFKDAIGGKDGLVIKGAHLSLFAVDDGIQVKDYVVIKDDAVIDIKSMDDGIKSFHDSDNTRGYTYIESGTLNITSGGDAIQAETQVLISDGTINILAGNGSDFDNVEELSLKGLKAGVGVIIEDGDITIDAADDAINSNGIISVNGGNLVLSSGDDAIHADVALEMSNANIKIVTCGDGVEANIINIQSGLLEIIDAQRDGINILREVLKSTISREKSHLYINGGEIFITALDDGIDVDGTFIMNGGELFVNGKTGGDKALSIVGEMHILGGLLVATQATVMQPLPLEHSSQQSLLVDFSSIQQKESLIHLQSKAGEQLLTIAPSQNYQSVFISIPTISEGKTYSLFYGGSSTGTVTRGIYRNGIYSPGSKLTEFAASNTFTHIQQ